MPPVPPQVVWLTGLSGAGKTTLARELVSALRAHGAAVMHLDGDEVRALTGNTGFDRASREAHVRRVGEIAAGLEAKGNVVVVSLISPFEGARRFARDRCRNFLEVYVSTPLAECERRDPKGLYARARRGEIRDFTGIDSPYERPTLPELEIDTSGKPLAASMAPLLSRVVPSP